MDVKALIHSTKVNADAVEDVAATATATAATATATPGFATVRLTAIWSSVRVYIFPSLTATACYSSR